MAAGPGGIGVLTELALAWTGDHKQGAVGVPKCTVSQPVLTSVDTSSK